MVSIRWVLRRTSFENHISWCKRRSAQSTFQWNRNPCICTKVGEPTYKGCYINTLRASIKNGTELRKNYFLLSSDKELIDSQTPVSLATLCHRSQFCLILVYFMPFTHFDSRHLFKCITEVTKKLHIIWHWIEGCVMTCIAKWLFI